MSSLMAELQAKQRQRAQTMAATPSPAPVPVPAAGTNTPDAPAATSSSGLPLPPAGRGPPPIPKSNSVILTSPPLQQPPPLPAAHRGSVGPPPLPGTGAPPPGRPVPPPIPPKPILTTSPPKVSPGLPTPLPTPVVSATPIVTATPPMSSLPPDPVENGSSTPTAPDTPRQHAHRSSGSFSGMASLPPSAALPVFNPGASVTPAGSPSILITPPPSLPLPQLPTFNDEGQSTSVQSTPLRSKPSEASRSIFLNEVEHLDASFDDDEHTESTTAAGPHEFRLDVSGDIKLASTVRVYSESQENRFLGDFVPPIPAGADSLVAATLTSFTRPIRAFVKDHVRYQKLLNPNAIHGSGRKRDVDLVEFEVDEPYHDGSMNKGSGSSSDNKDSTPGKRKSGLADLFTQPTPSQTNSPASTTTTINPAAVGGMSPPPIERSVSDVAAGITDREAEVEALCNLNLLHILPHEAREAVVKDEAHFREKEENLFMRQHPEFDYKDALNRAEYSICKRLPPSQATAMWSRDVGLQLLVSINALRVGIGNVEPFFGTLALYDLKAGIRLTEDFHFDLNDNSLLTGQLEVNKSCADPITLCPHALFHVQDRHDQVVLVLRLERILQGDPDEQEHYHKLKSRGSAEMSALVKKTRNNLIYLSDYRQTFGWGFIPLFEETGELRNVISGGGMGSLTGSNAVAHEKGTNFVRFDRIFQQIDSLKDELFISLMRETRESVSKGGKIYPGTYLDVRMEEMDPNCLPVNRVDVSCIALKNTERTCEVKEIAEYNVAADSALPAGSPAAGAGLNISTNSSQQRPSITVPSTPMAGVTTPQTPSTASSSIPPTPSSGGATPHHAHSGSLSSNQSGSIAAALAQGPVAPPHSTTISNNPIPFPPMIREVEELTDYAPPLNSTASPPTPHTFFVNLLYLYPEMIKFEKFRNIACRIQFRNSDSNVVLEGMKVIHGKSSGSNFVLSSLTQVNYHKKQVTPQELVKIMLPISMNSSTHIFFTFYKVSCKTKPGKREIIGYSALRLFPKNRILCDDTYHLPIAAKLPKNYLTPFEEGKESDEIHFRSNGMKCFSVRIKLVSSIFSQDEHIYNFLQTFPNSKELIAAGPHHGKELLHKAIEHIHKFHPWYTVKFLPSLLDYLFELIQNRATANLIGNNANQVQASYFGFLGLTYLIFRISEYYVNEAAQGGNRCSILVAYITHRLENLLQPLVMTPITTSPPNAMGAEAGAPTAASAIPSINSPSQPVLDKDGKELTYVPLYSIFTKLWLAGLNPTATNDNAALFTLPSTTVAGSASLMSSASPGNIPSHPTPSSTGGASSASSSTTHQALHERLLISYAWFYFEVINKSLVLERDRQKQSKGHYFDDPHLLEFLKNFDSLIHVIVAILYKHRTVGLTSVKHLIYNLALFFNDLYAVLEKPRVVKFISTFLSAFRKGMNYADPVLVEIKFTFYYILFDFEWFMDVCELEPIEAVAPPSATSGPLDPEDETNTSTSHANTSMQDDESDRKEDSTTSSTNCRANSSNDLMNRIRAKYPLMALFISDYISNLSRCRESLIREKIINCLRMFLTKHDFDVRWQSAKSEIATMLLPLIPAHLEELEILKTSADREKERESEVEGQWTSQISSHKATSASSSAISSAPLSPSNSAAEECKLRRSILICVLWVMKNVPLPLLKEFWRRDLLAQSANSGSNSNSRENSVSDRDGGHSEGPFIDFVCLLDTCVNSFPYVGILKREADFSPSNTQSNPDADVILASETIAAASGMDATGAGGVADIKSDIEALMSNIHKTRTLGTSGGTLRAARASTIASDKSAAALTTGGTVGGKSTLRQLRAQLSNKNATIGPGGLNMAMLAQQHGGTAGGADIAMGGTLGRHATTTNPALMAAAAAMSSGGGTGTYRSNRTLNANSLTLTPSATRDAVIRIAKWEGYLSRSVSQIVVRLLHEFLEDYHDFIAKRKWLKDTDAIESNCMESFQSIVKIFTSFVASHQSNSTLLALYPTMLLFVQRYGRFFHLNSSMKKAIGTFTSVSFRVCAFAHREVRMHAVALIYSLLLNNYQLDQNLFHLQMHLTISLSKLTENLSINNEKYLQLSIQALMRTAAKSLSDPSAMSLQFDAAKGKDFKTRLDTLLGRLSTILSDSMEISRQTKLGVDADSATSENLLLQIADAFSHIPEIRIEWLNRLAHHHQREEQYAEAAQSYIAMADLVFSKGSSDEEGEGYSMVDSKSTKELDRLVSSYYELACKMLDKAELYEQCSDVYKLLQPIYHKYLDYKNLSISHYHLHNVFEKLMDANRKQSRMLGTYYRVGFYGLKFGPRLHGNEFIYKMPKITRLSEIATRMRTLYSNQLGVQVKVLPDSNPVDISKLENIAEECLLQITFVSPSFLPEGVEPNEFESSIHLKANPRITWIEQHTRLQAFKFSTPFTSGGKTFGSVTEQHKRNTVLYVRAEFPYILTAQSVVKRVETILSPIASATEDVILRTNSLLEVISSDTLNAKVLTGLLAGSVATQVHGGSKEICQAFLSDDSATATHGSSDSAESPVASPASPGGSAETDGESKWSHEDQEKLKDAMRKFVEACTQALEANKKLAEKGGTEAEKEFQANLEQQFEELKGTIIPLICEAKKPKKKGGKKGVRFG